MNSDFNISKLNLEKVRRYFSTLPVENAWLFGSYARGEETPDSDVDILVTYTPDKRPGLFGIVDIVDTLEEILGVKVDLVERCCMFPRVAKEVEKQKIQIYERVS